MTDIDSQTDWLREREIEIVKPRTVYSQLWVNGSTNGPQPINVGITGKESTYSRRGRSQWNLYHQLKRSAERRNSGLKNQRIYDFADLGNEFQTTKKWVEHGRLPDVSVSASSGIYSYVYQGPWVAKESNVGPTSSMYPAVPGDLRDRMIVKGTTAIARTIPTNPVASAAQFIGELREGLPTIPFVDALRKRTLPEQIGSVGGEYLNFEFGIKPLVSDLRKFGEAARSSSKVIEQLKRDSGRLIRRRYAFPVERTISEPVVQSSRWYGSPGLRLATPNAYSSGPGKLTFTREETYEYWFSGAYTYLYVNGDRAVDKMRAAEQRMQWLFGTRVNPELLWELTPWSWAADWFGNAGDVLHNLSAFSSDSLVMRWGYVMCTYTCRDTYLAEGVSLKGNASGPLTQTFVTQVKKRVKATPYGFGLDPDAFTPRQWAILGALGLSRGSKLL